MSQIADLTAGEARGSHIVQFYDAEPAVLVRNVADFIDEGMRLGESVVVIATPEHGDAFMSALGQTRGPHDLRSRRLVFLDAQATLDAFMLDGRPDWRRFEQIVGGAIRGMQRSNPSARLRAYGEMVGILWAAGNVQAATQLEKFWNVLLGDDVFTLFCGYPIDVFADAFDIENVHELLCAHTHVLPGGNASAMERALDRAMREILGDEAETVRRCAGTALHPAWGGVPSVEATILWLRNHQPAYATQILARAKSYYRASP